MPRVGNRPFVLAAGIAWLVCVAAHAERPRAADLFPLETVGLLTIPDAGDLNERVRSTAIFRMSQDPQMKPIVDQIYGTLVNSLSGLQDQFGVSFDELLTLPQGEMVIGLLPIQGQPPAAVLVMDAGERLPKLRGLVNGLADRMAEGGAERAEEKVGGTTVVVYDAGGSPPRQAAFFDRDGSLVLGTRFEAVQLIAENWEKGAVEPLSQNKIYTALLRKTQSTSGTPPHATFFFDPINLFRRSVGNDAGGRVALALLPGLGLDGLLGLGGSATLVGEQFDLEIHLHLLLDTPREAVVNLIALRSGDLTPENWVTAEASDYTSLYWDVEHTYDGLSLLIDSFQGQGFFADSVAGRVYDVTGLDFEKDILIHLENRVSIVNWTEKPAGPASQRSLVGFRLRDKEKFKKSLDKMIDFYKSDADRRTYAGKTYYVYVGEVGNFAFGPQARFGRPGQGQPPLPELPPAEPSFAVLDDYFLLADRPAAIEKAIQTATNPELSLAGDLEFKLISGTIRRQVTSAQPGMITFRRPEEQIRFLYDMAAEEKNRTLLASRAEENPFLKGLNQALDDNRLPPFEVLKQYLAPAGALLTDDDTGLHYTYFVLRRKQDTP
jgi:hypothetical protein